MRTLALLLGLLVLGFFVLAPAGVERALNRRLEHPPYAPSEVARALHARIPVADLHADSLLWGRDLLERSERGHVDVPRLQEGGFALQVFPAVTKSPVGQNYERNDASRGDMITALVAAQRWPLRTWRSLTERAIYQADRLHAFADRAPEALRVIETRQDLARLLRDREAGATVVGGVLATEGSHALEGELDNIERLYAAGFRMMGLHHFFDNELGGSLHGTSRGGLSDFGREAVQAMQARGVIVDVAHSSPGVVDDVLALVERPIVISHTGMYGHCAHRRNLDDARLERIAAAGGLVGIGFWDAAVCDPSAKGVARAILYAVEKLGAEHVALGSDWDGSTAVAIDAGEIAALTDALLAEGVPPETIESVMGRNLVEFLRRWLPEE